MDQAMKGLRLKPKYEDLINVAVSDGLEHIKFVNRNAQFLRNGFVLSQLDGEGMRAIERQQELASKEPFKKHLLKEIAKSTGANIHGLRNDSHQEVLAERVETALHFDIAQGDDMESLHSLAPSIEPEIRHDISTRTIQRSESSHPPSQSMSNVTHESAAVRPIHLLRVCPTKSFDSRFGGLRFCHPLNLRVSSGVKLKKAINSNS